MYKKRLPYPWLRNPRLIPPLFKAGDEVRIRQGGAARLCFPRHIYQHELGLTIRRPYHVRQVDFFEGRTKYLSGYKVELEEFKAWWFWGHGFIRWDYTGWVAPASDLRLINREFFKNGADYSKILRLPSHIKEDFRELYEFLQEIDIIIPGKLVRPIGPAVLPIIQENDEEAFIGPLDPHKEYLVADFYHGHEGKVLLHGARGAYSIKFLEAV